MAVTRRLEAVVHETYRMLGADHEAELAREARKRQLAAQAGPRAPKVRQPRSRTRVIALLLRPRSV